MLCYVKCPRGCWRRVKEKQCMRVYSAQPSVHKGYPNPFCTCLTNNMGQHALTVHGISKKKHKKQLQALEYDHFLAREAALAKRFMQENRRMCMISGRKVDEADGWVFVELSDCNAEH